MKLADIVKVLAQELGTSDLKEINKLLKDKATIKFRITGKSLGHYGFTGQIKGLTEEGVKAYMGNKVSLIRLSEIETFEKAKPREERPMRTGPKPPPKKTETKKSKVVFDDLDDDDDEDDEDLEGDVWVIEEEETKSKKAKKSNKTRPTGKSGSRFIPVNKK